MWSFRHGSHLVRRRAAHSQTRERKREREMSTVTYVHREKTQREGRKDISSDDSTHNWMTAFLLSDRKRAQPVSRVSASLSHSLSLSSSSSPSAPFATHVLCVCVCRSVFSFSLPPRHRAFEFAPPFRTEQAVSSSEFDCETRENETHSMGEKERVLKWFASHIRLISKCWCTCLHRDTRNWYLGKHCDSNQQLTPRVTMRSELQWRDRGRNQCDEALTVWEEEEEESCTGRENEKQGW